MQKNIAVLMTALDSDGQSESLKGIEEYAKSHDCNVAVFLWFTGAFEKDKHNAGEINIVNLPDLNLYDGVILFSNTLHMKNNKERIEELMADLTCPLVTIGCEIEGAPQIRTDSYGAMRELVEHYVVDHSMRRIHFVKGIEGNSDAEERFRAYVDVLTEHNIPVLQECISQGDFYVTGGELAAREILNSGLPFPEAIVCANDIMAITICDILTEEGYRVPEDVVISGYDYTLEGLNHKPRITTVRCRFRKTGETACRMLLDRMEGRPCEEKVLLPDEVIYGESCGCHGRREADEEQRQRTACGMEVAQRIFIHQMIKLEKNLIESSDYDHWLEAMKEFIQQINPREFYFCANEDFVEKVFETGGIEQEDMDEEERLAYSPKMNVILAYQNGMFRNRAPFPSEYGFDGMFQTAEEGKVYIFSPLHYQDRNFGYFVFVDSTFPVGNQMYISWLISMGNAIENIRKQSLLRNAMKRLDEMYIKDSLTGAYNRFGMERFFTELKHKCMMSKQLLQVSFTDIDGLKLINDKYGHEEGDRIISAAADILQKKAKKSYVVRYGGDEFIVIGTVSSEKEIEDYWKRVEEEIIKYNEQSDKKAQLSISYGYQVFKVDATTYLEDCIRVTDNRMYSNKNRKKEQNKEKEK